MKKADLNIQEVKWLLKQQGVKVRPSYVHDDYIFTSFTMPHPLKKKLDKICEVNGLTRSKLVQLLIDACPLEDLAEYLGFL